MDIYKKIDLDKYQVIIGTNILSSLPNLVDSSLLASKVFIITDVNVSNIHLHTLKDTLSEKKILYHLHIISAGESSKNYQTAEHIIEDILSFYPDRNSTIIALGGGVIGDISGFIASIILRGINLIHVPTSLLAQVDSCIGGKTAINSRHGKNLIGTFYNPVLVLIDISLLKTLDKRNFISGIAEVIKYAIISDVMFLEWIEKNVNLILNYDILTLQHMISHSCNIKFCFTLDDYNERLDRRILLNFGHTFAHALEACTDYTIFHGEAVSLGMVIAAKISYNLGYINKLTFNRICFLLRKIGLPTSITKLKIKNIPNIEMIFSYIKHDKKNLSEQLNLILIDRIGNAFIERNISHQLIRSTLNSFLIEK